MGVGREVAEEVLVGVVEDCDSSVGAGVRVEIKDSDFTGVEVEEEEGVEVVELCGDKEAWEERVGMESPEAEATAL